MGIQKPDKCGYCGSLFINFMGANMERRALEWTCTSCGFVWFVDVDDEELHLVSLDDGPVVDLTGADDFALAHAKLLEENKQLRARFEEQCRIIEEKRARIAELERETKCLTD